nr:uncharacterized protein LOC123758020 isoform X2 [Procambarus clarkii]
MIMASAVDDSESEGNFVRYLLAVQKGSRRCLEEAFGLLYRAWGRGKSYTTLEEFCVDALGWQREDLANFYEAQDMLGSSPNVRPPSLNPYRDHSEPSALCSAGPGVLQASRPPLEDVKSPVFGSSGHLIRHTTRSVRQRRSLSKRGAGLEVPRNGGPGLCGSPQRVHHLSPLVVQASTASGSTHLPLDARSPSPITGNDCVAPLKHGVKYVAPSTHTVDFVAPSVSPSKQEAGPDVASNQDINPVGLSKQGADTAAPSKQGTDTAAPSKQGTDTAAPLKQGADTAAPLKQEADTAAPPKQGTDTAAPLKQEADTAAPLKHEADTAAPSKQKADTAAPSKQGADTAAPLKQEADTATPPKQGADTAAPLKQEADTAAPLKQEADTAAPSKQGADTAAPLKQEADTAAPSKQGADTAAPSQQEVDTAAPLKQGTDTAAPSKQGTDTAAPSKQGTDTAAPSKQGTDTAAPLKQGTDTAAPSKQGTDTAAPLKQGTDTVAPSKQGTDTAAPSKQGTDTAAPLKQGTDTAAPLKQGTDTAAPSKQEAGCVAASKQKDGHVSSKQNADPDAPSKKNIGPISLSKQKGECAALSKQTSGSVSSKKDDPVAPLKQKIYSVAPSKQKNKGVAVSKHKSGHVAPSEQKNDSISQSKRRKSVSLKQKDDSVAPSKPIADPLLSSRQNVVHIAPLKQKGVHVASSKQKVIHVAPSKQKGKRIVISKQKDDSVPSSKQKDDSVPLSKQKDDSVPSSKQKDDSVPSSKQKDDSIPSKQKDDSIPSKQKDDSVPSKQKDDSVPSKQKDDSVPSSKQKDDSIPPSKQKDDSIPSKQKDDSVPSKQKDDSVPSKQKDDSVPPSKQKDDSVPSSKQKDDSVPSSKQKDDSVPPSKQKDDSVPPSKQKGDSVSPSTQKDDSVPPSKQKDDSVPPSKQKDDSVPPSTQRDDSVPLSKQKDDSVPPSTQKGKNVATSKLNGELVASSKQMDDSVASKQKGENIATLNQRGESVAPSKHGSDRVASSTHGGKRLIASRQVQVELQSIIREASRSLVSPDALHSNRTPETGHGNILEIDPDPSQLPQKVLAFFLREGFPELPARARYLLWRLERLVYVVCYRETEFDDQLLTLRLRDLGNVISEMLSIVIHYCIQVTERSIKDATDQLRIAKQRLRKAQKVFEKQVSFVMKTREELKDAERDLQEAKVKNCELYRVYSRSQSWEPEENSQAASANTSGKAMSFSCVGAAGNCSIADVNAQGDSGNVSLADEVDGSGLETKHQDGVLVSGDSLFVSVMKEVAVIERRHSTLWELDRKLKRMLRNSQESVIFTKKEVRDRLDSNVSAEQEAIAKDDIVSERYALASKLSREIKNLRKDYNSLQEDEAAMISGITDDIEMLRMMELSEEAMRAGGRDLQVLRESHPGRLLMEARQHTTAFASSVKIFDVGEWLMRKRCVTMDVQSIYSRLKINNTENTVDLLDILGTSSEDPSVIILSGPKGSGKSCVCHYLQHLWKLSKFLDKSRLHEFDLVVYCRLSDLPPSESWSQYLKDHVFCLTLRDFPDTDVFEALGSLTVLFLLDVGSLTSSSSNILKDVISNLGKNRAIITVRPGSESDVLEITKGYSHRFLRAKLCPMTLEAVKAYSTRLLSMVENEGGSAEVKVNQFTKFIESMNKTETLMYPLHVAYLLYLWRVAPLKAVHANCVSRLYSQVVILCQHTLTEVLRAESKGDRATARERVDLITHRLYEAAWRLITHHNWQHDGHTLLEPEHKLMDDPVVFTIFSPLVVVVEEPDGIRRGILPHPSIAEIFCGFFLANQKLLRSKGSPLLPRRDKIEKFCIPELKRFRYVLPHTAGALVYNKHSLDDAKEIASVYLRSLSEDRDMESWLELLRECDFITHMCAAVSGVLARYSSWTIAHHDQQTNCAVADLLRKGAYQPKFIIISQPLKSGKGACIGDCVIRALSTCSATLVHIRQESQFYAWGEDATCDSLVVPLQPPGTLRECWGHLGVEGAMALRHSHYLEELNVRISSSEALAALVLSIEHLKRSLRYLYIRLDILPSTPASSLQPLNFSGKKLWLRMRGINDSTVDWIKEVTGILNSWYTEVLLEESCVSPSALQSLKESLPNTRVHISS